MHPGPTGAKQRVNDQGTLDAPRVTHVRQFAPRASGLTSPTQEPYAPSHGIGSTRTPLTSVT